MSSLPRSQNRASHRRVGNGFKGDAARRRTRFFDSASAFAEDGYGGRAAPLKMTVGERAAYHCIQCGRMYARATNAKNPRITCVVIEKLTRPLPPLKNIGGLEANLGD